MRMAAYDCVTPSNPLDKLPVTISQSSTRLPAALMLALVATLLVLIAVPFSLILVMAAGEPAARALLLERPGATLQMGLGVVVWLALFAWPANRLLTRLTSARTVRIDAGHVHVTEKRLTGTRTWTLPLAAFDGLAHHVRASLSGTRHELILAHHQRNHSVLVAVADRISQAEIERTCRLLGVREIPARALYHAIQTPAGQAPAGLPAGPALMARRARIAA